MDDFEEENTEQDPSNRKPISYSTEFRLDINLNNFVIKLCPAMYEKCVSRNIMLYLAFINEIIQREEIMEA